MKHSIKAEIRKTIKNRINNLSAEEKQKQINSVFLKLIAKLKEIKTNNVLVFIPLSDEIDITAFVKYLLDRNYNVFAPVSFENSIMNFYKIKSISDTTTGRYGISEPIERIKYKSESEDIIIVPGVAFDSKCNRLGRGKGYYDIFLSQNNLYSIGVSYNEQILNEINTEEHDFVLNEVITERFDFKKELT